MIELPGGGQAVVASAEDYEAAYQIFKATCERSVFNLSKTHKKILDAMHRLQKELEDRSDWLSWTGLTQRKIAQAAGVSQSTVSENKTFLVKSAKLVREVGEGGLALVKDAEPSWWDTGDALLGFPKPEEVRSWWGGDDPPPPSPEGADRADHEPDTAPNAASEAVNGDRRDADQERGTDDHYDKKGAAQGDRRAEAGDRRVADQENGLLKANDPSDEEVIGVIGDSLSDDLSFESMANSADHGGEPEGRPTPVTNRDSSDGEECSRTKGVNATAGEESQERLAKVEEALRHYGIDLRAEAVYYNLPRLQRDGVFDAIGFVPTDREVEQAQRSVLAGWTLPTEEFEKGPGSWPPSLPPPIEDAGAIHCDVLLHRVWKNSWHKNERDPEALRDAVAADPHVFFVPTVEEIVQAMRMRDVEPEFPSDRQTAPPPEVSPSTGPSEEPISELERALRSAQRAPRPLWPGNNGSPNKLQEWVQAKGRKYVSGRRRPAIREVISELRKKGYLETKPPEKEVKEVLAKMVREIDEAEDRHHERVWRGHR
jgi:DNA-binding Lrp family transcriptional regulator